jgi:hypothetical protein
MPGPPSNASTPAGGCPVVSTLAFYGHDSLATALVGGAAVSVTVRMHPAVKRPIAEIPESVWKTIEYTDTRLRRGKHNCEDWVSRAEIAETVFPQKDRADHRPPGRAPDPAVNPKATDGQPTLFETHRTTHSSPPRGWRSRDAQDHDRAAQRAEKLPRRCPLGDAGQGQVRDVVAGQPAGQAPRRARMDMDQSLTFNPSRETLQIYRSCWERDRAVPVILTAGVLAVLDLPAAQDGYLVAALLGTLVVLGAGAVAAGSSVAAKWLLVRPISGIKRSANVRISRRRLEDCASSTKGSYAVVAATEAMIVFRSSAPITACTVV